MSKPNYARLRAALYALLNTITLADLRQGGFSAFGNSILDAEKAAHLLTSSLVTFKKMSLLEWCKLCGRSDVIMSSLNQLDSVIRRAMLYRIIAVVIVVAVVVLFYLMGN